MKRIVFTGKQRVELEDAPLPEPGAREVLVRTRFSLMSTGTEGIVFGRLFDAGTHWDQWVKYPFYPGYASVGEVVALGKDVRGFAIGDRVTHRKGHCSDAVVPADDVVRIPDELPMEQAVWFALAKIGFHGALAARYSLGDSVLIIGAGPVGQMSVRWAHAAGASVIAVADIAAERLELARPGGATLLLPGPIEQAGEALLAHTGNVPPGVVVDSTGNAAIFSAALGLAADHGRVILLGDTGQPSQQTLTKDVITRGLTIAGAHDNHISTKWNLNSITRLFFDLAGQGRFSLEGLNSHAFAPAECADAYETANRERAKTMGILFHWNES